MYGQFHGLGGFSSVRSATQDNLAVRTRGEIEAPAGTKDLGGWQASAYTPEQQKRLNIDGNGNQVALSSTAADAATGIDVRRPVSWLQNAICLYLFNLKFVFLQLQSTPCDLSGARSVLQRSRSTLQHGTHVRQTSNHPQTPKNIKSKSVAKACHHPRHASTCRNVSSRSGTVRCLQHLLP